jgi:hypothetical protein
MRRRGRLRGLGSRVERFLYLLVLFQGHSPMVLLFALCSPSIALSLFVIHPFSKGHSLSCSLQLGVLVLFFFPLDGFGFFFIPLIDGSMVV